MPLPLHAVTTDNACTFLLYNYYVIFYTASMSMSTVRRVVFIVGVMVCQL